MVLATTAVGTSPTPISKRQIQMYLFFSYPAMESSLWILWKTSGTEQLRHLATFPFMELKELTQRIGPTSQLHLWHVLYKVSFACQALWDVAH